MGFPSRKWPLERMTPRQDMKVVPSGPVDFQGVGSDAGGCRPIYVSYLDYRYIAPYTNIGNRYMSRPSDLVQGTLDLLLLKMLALEPLHGWAIAQRLHAAS